MLEASIGKFTYDSANRLTVAGTRYYVYDVEGTRIKTQKGEDTTKFVYNVNARLSQLLVKTENNADTKYVYGLGLIGEETSGNFKTYHFDYRGSTVAITNASGTVTDTFEYDTYGKLTAHSGSTDTQFLYNGRDGVMTEDTGLIYMRARYYSPVLRRFVNADKVHGDISNSLSLNRYSFCNGDPANGVDPEGLSAERVGIGASMGAGFGISETTRRRIYNEAIRKYRKLHPVGKIDVEELKRLMGDGTSIEPLIKDNIDKYYSDKTFGDYYLDALTPSMGNYVSASKALMDAQAYAKGGLKFERHGDYLHIFGNAEVKEYIGINSKNNRIALKNIDNFEGIADLYSAKQVFKNNAIPGVLDGVGWAFETYEESKQFEDTSDKVIIGVYNATSTIVSSCASAGVTSAFTAAGTMICPGLGTVLGFVAGYFVGALVDAGFDYVQDEFLEPWLIEN